MMRRTTALTEVVIRSRRRRRGTAAAGLAMALLLLASCAEAAETTAENADSDTTTTHVDATSGTDVDCGRSPVDLTEELDGTDEKCSYSAPVRLTAIVAGELRVVSDDIGLCAVDGSIDGASSGPMVLAAGDTVNMTDRSDQPCRFRFSWMPSGSNAPASTTTTAPTTTTTTATTTTTTTTTSTTTTTTTTTPPPTTTSAVGS